MTLELKSLSLDITGEVSNSSSHQQGSTNHYVNLNGAAVRIRTSYPQISSLES